MNRPAFGLTFREMTLDDVPQVIALERQSFSLPWSEGSFRQDLTGHSAATLVVAEREGAAGRGILGYGGYWLIVDEAHVSTLAVDPAERRKGVGEAMMRELMRRAAKQGATMMTLEVRVSNLAARRLYARLGFVEVGLRRGYYRDNREDAVLMTRASLPREVPAAEETALER